MKTETALHKVKIDQYTTIEMAIPIELNAIELKGIMMKVNKLFNISDVAITETRPRQQTKWTPDMEAYLLKNMGRPASDLASEITEKFGTAINSMSIYTKRKQLKERGITPQKSEKTERAIRTGSVWTEKAIEVFRKNQSKSPHEVMELIKKAEPRTEITVKKIQDRRYYDKKVMA